MSSDLWRKDKFQSHISDIGLRQETEGRRGRKAEGKGKEKEKREKAEIQEKLGRRQLEARKSR